jgi:hypothetical protein
MPDNKDWTGNKKSTFATLGASNHSEHDREINDYYATEPNTIDALFKMENFEGNIWECACGEGHLSKRMIELGKEVISTDLINRGYGISDIDFLKQTKSHGNNIVTNPPYKYAQEFVEKAIELSSNKIAMFLKLTFLEGQKRRKMFDKHPPKYVYVFSQRKKCALNGKFEDTGSSAAAYAWFVWYKDCKGDTTIKWI